MNIEAEKKRLCRLKFYMKVLDKNTQAIEICKEKISEGAMLFGLDFSSYYKKRILKQNELKIWLQNRYKNVLIS